MEGLCQKCYNKDHPLIEFSTPLSVETCKRCGAVKVPGGWKTINGRTPDEVREEQVQILLDAEIKPLVKGVNISLEEENRLDRVLHLRVIAQGRSAPSLDEHEETYPVEIRFSNSICDTCSMMSGGYYEAILQIRADSRPVNEDEERSIAEFVTERTISAYGRDSRAFIVDVINDKYGVDFYIGSEHLCRLIAEEIESLYLAERKDNYKLVSQERGGKGKYRITILLRLPRYSIGDFVKISGHPCQVIDLGKGGLACYDLIDKQNFTINKKSAKWQTLSFIAEESQKRPFSVVANVFGQPLQVMDTKTFEIVEISQSEDTLSVQSGDVIYMLKHEDEWFIVPQTNQTTS